MEIVDSRLSCCSGRSPGVRGEEGWMWFAFSFAVEKCQTSKNSTDECNNIQKKRASGFGKHKGRGRERTRREGKAWEVGAWRTAGNNDERFSAR